MDIEQGGLIANRNGRILEMQVKQLLLSKKYLHANICRGTIFCIGENTPWFKTQMKKMLGSIYNLPLRADFFVSHPDKWPKGLVIETKWQSSAGSVDEKYPYTVLSLKELPYPAVLMIAGGGYRQNAINWCKDQQTDDFIVLEGLDETIKWAQRSL